MYTIGNKQVECNQEYQVEQQVDSEQWQSHHPGTFERGGSPPVGVAEVSACCAGESIRQSCGRGCQRLHYRVNFVQSRY